MGHTREHELNGTHTECLCKEWFGKPKMMSLGILFFSGYYIYHHVRYVKILRSAHRMHVCFVWISEQTAIISLYSIECLF